MTRTDDPTDGLGLLAGAIEAARRLGMDTTAAERVRDEIRERLANPDDVYVLALIGGISLVNAGLALGLGAIAAMLGSSAFAARHRARAEGDLERRPAALPVGQSVFVTRECRAY